MSTPSPFEDWHRRICQVIGSMATANMAGSASRRDLAAWGTQLMKAGNEMVAKSMDDETAYAMVVMSAMSIQVKQGVTEGYVPCPKCQGNVKFRYVGPRHASAKCQTPDCTVRFMA